jgi:hypothetical protein
VGSLSVILSRDEREGVVGAGGGETEGEESSSRSDCCYKKEYVISNCR